MKLTLDHAVFLEKTAFLAYMNPDDSNYPSASSFFIELDDLDRHFVTTNHTVFTVHQWLRDEYGYTHADYYLNIVDKAVQKEKVLLVPGTPDLENKARQLLLQCPEYEISLEEAMNAIVITDYEIKRVFSFNPKYRFLSKIDEQIKVIPSA